MAEEESTKSLYLQCRDLNRRYRNQIYLWKNDVGQFGC